MSPKRTETGRGTEKSEKMDPPLAATTTWETHNIEGSAKQCRLNEKRRKKTKTIHRTMAPTGTRAARAARRGVEAAVAARATEATRPEAESSEEEDDRTTDEEYVDPQDTRGEPTRRASSRRPEAAAARGGQAPEEARGGTREAVGVGRASGRVAEAPSGGKAKSGLKPSEPTVWVAFPLAPELEGAPVVNGDEPPAPQAWVGQGGPPPKGLLGYAQIYECVCGRVVTPNHIGQCVSGQAHWALNQIIRGEYDKTVARLDEAAELPSGWDWDQADVPPFRTPLLLHPLQFQEMKHYFPKKVGEDHEGPAGKAARAFVVAEEQRFWRGEPTHRSMAVYVSRLSRGWPWDGRLRTATAAVAGAYADKVPRVEPGWTPRDLVVAQAVKNATYRNGGTFNLLKPNLMKSCGSSRGMMTTEAAPDGSMVGVAGDELIKYAIREDQKNPSQDPWLPTAIWEGEHKARLEACAEEVKREDEHLKSVLALRPRGHGPEEAPAAAEPPEEVEGRELIEIPSDDEEVLALPRSAKKQRR